MPKKKQQPKKCHICHKWLSQPGNLNRHLEQVHGLPQKHFAKRGRPSTTQAVIPRPEANGATEELTLEVVARAVEGMAEALASPGPQIAYCPRCHAPQAEQQRAWLKTRQPGDPLEMPGCWNCGLPFEHHNHELRTLHQERTDE